MGSPELPGDRIPHQTETEQVIDERLEDSSDAGPIADVADAAADPTQAEFNALVASHNDVLGVLRDAGLIPAA